MHRALLAIRLLAAGTVAVVGFVPPVALTAEAALAQDPAVAPATTTSADGRTVSGGGKSLSASQVRDLAASGQSITVQGSGYDVHKGVYVTLCVIPPTNQPPTPCGGGQDRAGTSDTSAWVSSNPPNYADGLTQPYGPGGSFRVTLRVHPQINDSLDCFSVRCAVVTRNDHTRGSDRSQDLFIPVTFVSGTYASSTTTRPPPVQTTTMTAPAPDPSTIAPTTTLSADGRSVTDGVRRLEVSASEELDPAGSSVTVSGAGYDPRAGIYVALCRVPEAGQAPGPCATGTGSAAWITSSPPAYGADLAVPFDDGGRFAVTLDVGPVIDGATDCREVACAITTRSDDTTPNDRTRDLLVPVAFGDPRAPNATETTTVQALASTAETPQGRESRPAAIVAAALLAAVCGVGVRAYRRRRSATSDPGL